MRDEVVSELIGLRLLISRTPCTFSHRDVSLIYKPAKGHGVVGRTCSHTAGSPALLDDVLLQHRLGLPFECIGLWADRNVAVTTNRLSVLILLVHHVLAVPHLHLLPRKVDGALLILHCHACSPFLTLFLVVENFF